MGRGVSGGFPIGKNLESNVGFNSYASLSSNFHVIGESFPCTVAETTLTLYCKLCPTVNSPEEEENKEK